MGRYVTHSLRHALSMLELVPPPRAMTAQEAWLNDLAQTEAFSGLVTIWHEGENGALDGFTALLPDVGRMAFIGCLEVEGE